MSESEIEQLKSLIDYFCEQETEIREIVRPILGETETDGDSHFVPSIVDLVQALVDKLEWMRHDRR